MKRFDNAVAALALAALFAAPAFAFDSNRPPVPFAGAWSYSSSSSRSGKSKSESLSVRESAEAGFADIMVEEMVNNVTHKKSKDRVPFKDINTVLDKLVTEAKKGL